MKKTLLNASLTMSEYSDDSINSNENNYKALVIGVSAGGLNALKQIIPELPANFPLAVIIVQHRKQTYDDFLVEFLTQHSSMNITSASPNQPVKTGTVYIAPAGYHTLVERNQLFSLSVDEPVNFSIPSIDVLFESAAFCYQEQLIGLVLTGASSDGSLGLKCINDCHGLSLVQDPNTAEYSTMPKAAIETSPIDYIIPLTDIADFLIGLVMDKNARESCQ